MAIENSAFVFPLDIATDFFYSLEINTLIVVPALCFPFLLASFLYSYRHQPQVAELNGLLYAKLLIVSLLCCAETLFAIVGYFLSYHHTNTAAVLPCLMTWGLLTAVKIEHHFASRPTSRLAIWLALSFFFDFQRLQRYSLDPNAPYSATCFLSASVLLKLVLILLGEPPKLLITLEKEKDKDTNANANGVNSGYSVGFWSRTFLFCLDPAIPALHWHDSPITAPELRKTPSTQQQTANTSASSSSFLMFLCAPLVVLIVALCSSRLVLAICKLSQITVLEKLLIFMESEDKPLISQIELVSAAFSTYSGIALSRCLYKGLSDHIVILLRGRLVKSVYKKLFTIAQTQYQQTELDRITEVYIEGVANGVTYIIAFSGAAIEIAVCMKWMMQLVQRPLVLLLLLSSVLGFIILYLKRGIPESQHALETATRQRLEKTSILVSKIKAAKTSTLDDKFVKEIDALRSVEIDRLTQVVFYWRQIMATTGSVFWIFTGPIVYGTVSLASKNGSLSSLAVYPFYILVTIFIGSVMDALRNFDLTKTMFKHATTIQSFLLLDDSTTGMMDTSVAPDVIGTSTATDQRECKFPVPQTTTRNQELCQSKNCVVQATEASVMTDPLNIDSVLAIVALHINRHELTMVTGPSGCGKTAFLHSLMGEGVLMAGILHNAIDTVGYCSQVPWLRSVSIRHNIIGYQPFEAEWYTAVTRACLLEQDFSQLINGDLSLVGNNGQNLSRGQRCRIALARALYSRAPCLILDNTFASLDNQTRDEIFDRVFGLHGIWHVFRGAIIMTTNSRELLRRADRVICIDLAGLVTMHSGQEAEYERYLQDCDLVYDGTETSPDDGLVDKATKLGIDTLEVSKIRPRMSFLGICYRYLSCLSRKVIKRQVIFTIIAVTSMAFADAFICLSLSVMPANYYFLGSYWAISGAAFIFTIIFFRIFFLECSPSVALDVHQKLLDTVVRANLSFINQFAHGSIMNLFDQDLKAASEVVLLYLVRVVHQGGVLLSQFFIIAVVARYSLIFLSIYITGLCITILCYLRLSIPVRSLDAKSRSAMRNYLAELPVGVRHFKAFGWEQQVLNTGNELLAESQRHQYSCRSQERLMYLSVEASRYFANMAIIILITFYQAPIPVLAVGLMLVYLSKADDSTMLFVDSCMFFRNNFQILRTLFDFLDNVPRESDVRDEDVKLESNWPSKGGVVFENVIAMYNKTSPASLALKNFTVSLPAGYKIGITGRTGSGKSSLLMALQNFLDFSGRIQIDGLDISKIPHRQLRRHITTISHEPIDLGGSLRFNLLPFGSIPGMGKNTELESMDFVLESLGLSTTAATLQGPDVQVSSLKLSGQQRRLLSVAQSILRNFYTNSNLIVMDDFTGNIDAASETLVVDSLVEMFPDQTILMEMTRPELLTRCDLVVHMQNGRLHKLVSNARGPASMRENFERAQRKTAIEMRAKRVRLEARRAAKREMNRLLAEVSSSSSDSDFWNSS